MKRIIYLWPFQIISVAGIIYSAYFFTWPEILLFLSIGYTLALVGEMVGMHRYFSHNSFNVSRSWHIFLVLVSTLTISGPIVAWVSIHKNHHKYSDTEKDPHSPQHRGMWHVFFANWFYYRHGQVEQMPNYNQDPLLKFACDYYYHINICFILILVLINPYLLFPLYFYPGIIGSLFSSITNTYLHRGGKTHDSKIMSFIIGGTGHHKYHHDHPAESILPAPDSSGIIIKIIKSN